MPELKAIPIGKEDFKDIIDSNCYYVDKTLMIKDIIENGAKVTLFTRPRRFGKTLNMSMLRRYFEKTQPDKFSSIKEWHDGYKFGLTDIYNPRSVLNYINNTLSQPDTFPELYWSNTSSNSIIYKLNRYDLVLMERRRRTTSIIIEIKTSDQFKRLEYWCDYALNQIEENHYEAELLSEGYSKIIRYGIAFYKKSCMVKKAEK